MGMWSNECSGISLEFIVSLGMTKMMVVGHFMKEVEVHDMADTIAQSQQNSEYSQ